MASLKVLSQLFLRADWRRLSKADILAIRHDNDAGQLIDGRYYSPLIDSIADEIEGCRILTIASPYSYRVKTKSYAGALSFNGAFAREQLAKRLKKIVGLTPGDARIDTWRRIIRVVRPRCVVTIQPHASLCRACHELGVFVYDIQHGYIGPKNPSYGEDFQIGRDRAEMADCILCWDEGSASSIRGWTSKKQIEVRVIGNPWVNKFLTKRANDKVIRFLGGERQADQENHDQPRILVSLQWGLDNPELVPNQELFSNEFMPIELEKSISNTLKQCEWILRPHPAQYMDREVFRKLTDYAREHFGGGVRISTDEPLPHLLSNVDLHITYNSSVVIEADYFGVRSALLDPQINGGLWAGYFSTQIGKGIAKLLPCDEHAILGWIRTSQAKSIGTHSAPPVLEAYFEFLKELQAG